MIQFLPLVAGAGSLYLMFKNAGTICAFMGMDFPEFCVVAGLISFAVYGFFSMIEAGYNHRRKYRRYSKY